MPTEVREAIAESINCTICCPRSPLITALIRFSIRSSNSGRPARTKPPAAKPTIRIGNIAKMVKYVMPAA